MSSFRIGLGYDVHRLATGETLVLGGVSIDAPFGTVAHSDGDVLLHAICDAVLGAAALGDIGEHFPDTDPVYHQASSLDLLR
ncbi:MAG: 2-C-methyl-D-erythritol 2,4-cyclodiphosphate synthase, partial [Bacteroidetes bacterium]|nr:2-C-methyl-D-erythritol 2,4-cyclodiphosphate synthase [Bacteroidota bacterium]